MKILYWTSTLIILAFLLLSSYSYLFSKTTIEGIKDLGFPDFFRIQLAVLKLVAVILLLLPMIPTQYKEWAYTGVGLFLLTAIIAHIAHKDSIGITVINLILFAILILSNFAYNKILAY